MSSYDPTQCGLPQQPHKPSRKQQQDIWVITGPAGCGKSTVAAHIAQSLSLPFIEGDEFHPKSNIEKMSAGVPLTDADRWDWLILLREECLRRLSTPDPAALRMTAATSYDTKGTNGTSTPNRRAHNINSSPPNNTVTHSASTVAKAPTIVTALEQPSPAQSETQIPPAPATAPIPPSPPGVILTCSALKRAYRDILRLASSSSSCPTNTATTTTSTTNTQPNIHVHFIYLRAPLPALISRVAARQGHYMKESMVRSQFLSLEEPTPDEDDCFIVDVGGSMGESQEAALRAVEGVLEQVVVRETEGMQGSGRGRVV